jgi:hypothetical protein
MVFEDNLEEELAVAWPEWDRRRSELIRSGLGFHVKNAATYRHAAATATGEIPPILHEALIAARRLRS